MAEAARHALEPDFPGLVPASLREAVHPDARSSESGRRPRSTRDWVVDVVAFGSSLLLGGLLLAVSYASSAPSEVPEWQVPIDILLGLVACAALWVRRRWPVEVALGTAVISAFSISCAIAAGFALFTVAIHRPLRVAVWPFVASLVAGWVFWFYRPSQDSLVLTFGFSVVALLLLLAWGMFVRARRQLVWSLRERALRAEEQQHLLADQARLAERARIAREMHDVVAHKVSLVALQAGGLEVRPDLPPEEVARSAAAISAAARSALEELRGVVGVLRDGSAAPQAPQPTLADVEGLAVAAREAGASVRLELAVTEAASAPGPLGRDAYRVVQEALTNAAKHGGGSAHVVLRGAPGAGLEVVVRNPLPLVAVSRDALPGAGAGLIGLAERVELAGGTLSYGPVGREFVVAAHLPWPP